MNPRGSEQGDVILSGLLRMVAGLLACGLALFDGGAVLVNRMQLDEAARVAARAGAIQWSGTHSRRAVEAAVHARMVPQTGMVVENIAVGEDRVAVTLVRPAPVVLLDRVGPLAHLADGRVTSTSSARPF